MKVACVLGQGFEDSEFRVPSDHLQKEGYQVDVIGAKAGEELKGYSPDHPRADRRFVDFVRAFDESGKLIAAVCHGAQLLIAAHLVKGRTLTAWTTIQDDLKQIGATIKDEPVVRDRNWITSRKPDDLRSFSEAIVDFLEGPGAEASSSPRSATSHASLRGRAGHRCGQGAPK